MKDSVISQISVTQGSELSVNDMSPRVTTKKTTLPDKLEKDYPTVPICRTVLFWSTGIVYRGFSFSTDIEGLQKGELVLETTTGPDCFFIGGPLYDDADYDIEASKRTRDLDTAELLEQIPALQQLLFRVLGCQPQGAAVYNFVIQLALSMVAAESKKIYSAISDGTVNMVDKFFEMPRHDAVRALDIYRRAGQQAERPSEFYEICKSIDLGRGERFIKIEQISGFLLAPASFLTAMEEYVRDAPRAPSVHSNKGLNDATPYASDLDEKNAFALAIVPVATPSADAPSTGYKSASGAGWELALVTAPSSNESAASANKLEYSFSPSAHVIELGSGESKEVIFQATHVAYSAMGTISLLSGQPKEGVFVEARSESKGYYEETRTDSSGSYRLRGFIPDNLFSQGSGKRRMGKRKS